MPQYRTVRDLAKSLGVSEQTIRQWVREGRIPALQAKPRGKLLFESAQVAEALRQRKG